jgi:Na+-transporting methylmalonyl-CoA/oxaloacetate decarboxylase gamma subunit
MDLINQSLLITAIGMGLVFILIILLWGFMAVLVMATNRWDFMAELGKGDESPEQEKVVTGTGTDAKNPDIIAVAVAVATAIGRKTLRVLPTQPNASSSWQAVTRANTLAQISSINNRKPRG